MKKQQDFSGLMNDLQAKVKVTEVATPTQQVVPLVNKPTKRKGIDLSLIHISEPTRPY